MKISLFTEDTAVWGLTKVEENVIEARRPLGTKRFTQYLPGKELHSALR